MKKYLFIIVATFITLHVAAQTPPQTEVTISNFKSIKKTKTVLYIVDGAVVTQEAWDRIPKEELKSLKLIENIGLVFVAESKYHIATYANPHHTIHYDSVLEKIKQQDLIKNLKIIKKEQYIGSKTTIADSVLVKAPSFHIKQVVGTPVKPLWIIQNTKGELQVVKEKKVNELNMDRIKSIVIHRGSETERFKKYGDTSNGVVLITLRNPRKK